MPHGKHFLKGGWLWPYGPADRSMTKKKIILTSALLLAIGAVGYGGTSAYFSDYDNTPNTVTVGHNDTTIEEKFPDPTPKPVEDNPSYPKKVWVTNDGNGEALVDCYVRAEVTFSNSDIGQAVTLEGLNTADWTLGGDGFYYYKHILKKGESTTPLFTGVKINSDKVADKYKDILDEFEGNVYEEAVQSDGFASAEEAFARMK